MHERQMFEAPKVHVANGGIDKLKMKPYTRG